MTTRLKRGTTILATTALLTGAAVLGAPTPAHAAEPTPLPLPQVPQQDRLRPTHLDAARAPGIQSTTDILVDDCLTQSGTDPIVLRYRGANRYETAVCASYWTWVDHDYAGEGPRAKAVVLARGDIFPDALAAGPLAAYVEGPLLLTEPQRLRPEVRAEIERVLAPGGTVYLIGSTSALSNGIRDELRNAGYQVRRLAGSNRYETALAIAEELPDTSNFFFATGRNFPDALAAGTAAGALSLAAKLDGNSSTRPFALLLTDDDVLPPAVADFVLDRGLQFGVWTLVTAGGAADRALRDAFGADALSARFRGSNRYETAAQIAETVFVDADGYLVGAGVGLATGRNFPDALSATAALAVYAEPLLLTEPNQLSPATRDFFEDHAGEAAFLDIFGGTTAVSNSVANAAAEALR